MTEERPYKIYMHINKINGKMYIGQTKLDLKIRCGKEGSNYKKCPIFWNAIRKYGWDNFYHIVLRSDLTSEEADEKEKELILRYNTYSNKYGYNAEMGGKREKECTERCNTGKCRWHRTPKPIKPKKPKEPKKPRKCNTEPNKPRKPRKCNTQPKEPKKPRIRNTDPIVVPDDLYSWRTCGEPPSKVISIRDTLYNKTYVVYGYTAVEKLIGLKENHIKDVQDNMKLYHGRFIITTVTLGN